MRRLEFLMTQVRNSTDNKDTNGIATAELVGYFNDAQKYISTLIFKNNPYCDFFKTKEVYAAASSGIYTLPTDCYATNAISCVEIYTGETTVNDGYSRIKPISETEKGYKFGYYTEDNKVIVSGVNTHGIRITYFRQIPTLDVRRGRVIAPFTTTTFSVDAINTEALAMDDNYSLVGLDGVQTVKEIYSASTTSPLTANAAKVTEIVAAGSGGAQYLVSGTNATNKSLLPDVCEPYLLDYVRQRIYTRNNYEDANKQMYFTEQQRMDIISIFSKNKKDDDTIPTTDTEFLTW
jgi:hypothetical protein